MRICNARSLSEAGPKHVELFPKRLGPANCKHAAPLTDKLRVDDKSCSNALSNQADAQDKSGTRFEAATPLEPKPEENANAFSDAPCQHEPLELRPQGSTRDP